MCAHGCEQASGAVDGGAEAAQYEDVPYVLVYITVSPCTWPVSSAAVITHRKHAALACVSF